MAEVIRMPRLSDTMEEGSVDTWHKKVGDSVSEGDILAEIQTDKAVQEFESEFDGQVLYIGVEAGETVEIDAILCIIGEEGEDISSYLDGESKAEDTSDSKQKEEATPSKDNDITQNTQEPSQKEVSNKIPDNVNVIKMPRLSDTMEEGTLVSWLINEGDKVSEGDILAEIETDKAVQEFESEFDGTLLKQGLKEGESVPVDSLLAIIGPEGTDVSNVSLDSNDSVSTEQKEDKVDAKEAPKTENKQASSSTNEVKVASDTKEKKNRTDRLFVSPLARKLAEEKGYNLEDITGSGDNGRIIKRDIEEFKPVEKQDTAKSNQVTDKKDSKQTQNRIITGESVELPNSKMRQTIAKRLSASKSTVPHYYLNVEIDMEACMQARKQINAIAAPNKISFNDIIVKAAAMALQHHPQVNSTWSDESITQHGNINIGVAVAVEDGLVVPVVNNADQKSLTDISSEIKDLAGRSRDKKIKADEMQGSTFTVSNLGSYGIESFTSIINLPNSCILSVGAILDKPVVKNGAIVPGKIMKLSLACDHRTVDGATGSLFLQTLKNNLETPLAMFL